MDRAPHRRRHRRRRRRRRRVARRRRPDAPTQPARSVPTQLDRADFARPDAPWLVAVFTSATCHTCADVVAKAEVLASDDVAVDRRRVAGAAGRPRPLPHRRRAAARHRRRATASCGAASPARCRPPTSGPPSPRLARRRRRPSCESELASAADPGGRTRKGVARHGCRGADDGGRPDDVHGVPAVARRDAVLLRLLHLPGDVGRARPRCRRRSSRVPQQPSGLGWLPDGRMLVVSMRDRKVLRQEQSGELVEHADLSRLADRARQRHGRRAVGHRLRRQLRLRPDGRRAVRRRRRSPASTPTARCRSPASRCSSRTARRSRPTARRSSSASRSATA